jgi:hypothetical protein
MGESYYMLRFERLTRETVVENPKERCYLKVDIRQNCMDWSHLAGNIEKWFPVISP